MDTATAKNSDAIPAYVWLLCAALAATEPLMHLWLALGPGSGLSTGLRTGDSHMYLHAMEAFETGFHSPYASVEAPLGNHSWRYFALPTHFFYAFIGYCAHALHLPYFIALGFANGIGAFLFLLAAYRLLMAIAPERARLAFLLFALGGSMGGPLYLAAFSMGWHHNPGFEAPFNPFAAYTLVEGAHVWPVLLFPRAYYTVPLAMCFAAWTLLARVNARGITLAAIIGLLFAAQLINMRAGTFLFAMMVTWLWCQAGVPRARLAVTTGLLAVPVALGGAITLLLLRQHPSYSANVYDAIGETAWFSALLSAIGLHAVVAAPVMFRAIRTGSRLFRALAGAGLGYLAVWTLLYGGYQVYYGNLWPWGDVTAAIRVSDWALAGAVAGGAGASLLPMDPRRAEAPMAWAALWLIAAIAVSLSAWGEGAFMNFLPRRLLVTMALPLSILVAESLETMKRPRWRDGLTFGFLVCGAATILASTLCFQGPMGQRPGKGAFARIHYEKMSEADAALLVQLPPGRVLAPVYTPWSFTEVIALRPENSVAFGVGTLNHSDLAFNAMKREVDTFFEFETVDAVRQTFLYRWGIQYVYCPDTCALSPGLVYNLRRKRFLNVIAEEGNGVIFEVLEIPLIEE